jgi:hypothetical protein
MFWSNPRGLIYLNLNLDGTGLNQSLVSGWAMTSLDTNPYLITSLTLWSPEGTFSITFLLTFTRARRPDIWFRSIVI